MFELKISTNGAAFQDDVSDRQAEIRRLLIVVDKAVAKGDLLGALRDYNGNLCGHWSIDD